MTREVYCCPGKQYCEVSCWRTFPWIPPVKEKVTTPTPSRPLEIEEVPVYDNCSIWGWYVTRQLRQSPNYVEYWLDK